MIERDSDTASGILLLGRVLLASCFFPSAFARMSNISGFAVSLASKGMPYAEGLAALILVAEAAGPLALIFGFAPRLSASALIATTVITTGTLHRFWDFAGIARQTEQTIFMAQIGILSGLMFYWVSGPGAWSWQVGWSGAGKKSVPKKKQSRPRASRPRSAPARPALTDEEMADAA